MLQSVSIFKECRYHSCAGSLKLIFLSNALVWTLLLAVAISKNLSETAFTVHCGAFGQGGVAALAILSVPSARPFALDFEEGFTRMARESMDPETVDMQCYILLIRVSRLTTLAWILTLALAASSQELGFAFFRKRTFGEVVLCHLSPPLFIMLTARRASPCARKLVGFRQEAQLQDGSLPVASVDGVLIDDLSAEDVYMLFGSLGQGDDSAAS